ncbi:TonB-dependent receptor plug domain-containing protein [Seonamhaeicola aphaedonensis]|uniref:Outer membrane receptor protein involved in Fe transport n=1 Tax=Seonamhaeicola aphaedonensis TaxID=1461338 RepID=A0A3D9HDP7_9FLAO|nr:TonB-dependent receptor plug domain-containing protein [Seonamhaeicola aphaedonensis]RED47595.1 outer membrane receptor protein involved in Fe transport [Seonamhaeicola aphaedonensis]
MNRKGFHSFFVFLFFLNITLLSSQNVQKEKQLLSSVISTLETRYNVSFSYADKTIKDKKAMLPNKSLSLEEALELLKEETKLDFELLDDRFIAIKFAKKKKANSFRIQNLEEVYITNFLTTGLTKLNDGSITIKPESFGILPGLIEPDVLQTIQALPGVLSTDETVSNINVRGGTHDQNLLLWDGIKMYQSGHFFGLISAFNPYITKTINVYKNGSSAKYGDGISSIIDMQLPDDIDNEFKAGVGLNFINADGFAKIPLSNKTELQISSRRSVTDLIETATYDQYFKRIFEDSDFNNNRNSISQNESFYFYDITAKLLFDITEKDKLRFNFLNINNMFDYDEQSTINDRTEALNSNLSQQNLSVGLSYTRDWTNQLSTTLQAYASNYNLDATNNDVINNQRLIQENRVNDRAFKLDINYEHNYQLKFNSGYQLNEVGISNLEDVNNPNFKSFVKNVVKSHSIYAETSLLSYGAQTKLNLGARLNYLDKFNMVFVEPRLSFSQRFLNDFRFEILGEYKSQFTSQVIDLQNDFLGIEKRRWILSNNNTEVIIEGNQTIYPVPVLKSKQISAGIHFNKNKFLISAETYIKKVDGITTRSQGFQNQYQFVHSIGSYKITGIDVLLNKQFDNVASTWISYSFSRNNYLFPDLNNGNEFPNNNDIRHAITFAGTYTQNNFKLALGINWNSGIPTTYPADQNNQSNIIINYQSPNAENLDDYLRTDFSATYSFDISRTSKATIGASVWNVLNRKNIINEYYTLIEDNIEPVRNESLGITPNVSFRVHF